MQFPTIQTILGIAVVALIAGWIVHSSHECRELGGVTVTKFMGIACVKELK